ncbi:MAG: mechanosensitive ion channel family protein [Deltaproteobacteria bacterium]|nr:mechanosensitive ion channel family protein [Deltaproteobacteria bacterium]
MVLVLLVAALLLRAIRLLTDRFSRMLSGLTQQSLEQQKRVQTLSYVARAVTTTALLVVTGMLVLGEVGIDVAPLLAAAGIGGLAIGFGAQNLVRDVIAGFFLLLEDQIRVGDVVRVGDKSGQVEQIGLRVLTLRDCDGSVHIIPNGAITTVTNLTKEFSYAVLHLGVPYRADIDAAIAVLTEVGAELRRDPAFAPDLLEELEVVGVDDFTDVRMKITVRVKTVPIKQWRVARELRRRIKIAFDAHGIEFV